jgi:hypothetical protein
MVLTFTDQQTAVDAPRKQVQWLVLIGGVQTDCTAVTTRYDVDAPVGTCTITLPLPLPEHVTFGAEVEVQAGYPGVVGTIFRGRIPRRTQSIRAAGKTATITAASHGQRLARPDYVDVTYAGPISMKALFEALCARRRVELYRSDDTTAPDGTTVIALGSNTDVNEGRVHIRRKTRTLDLLTRTAALFGYRVFDTAEGVRQQRVSGLPDAEAAITVTEAWNALTIEQEDDVEGLVNYWEVLGARYTDSDGVPVAIRSIPLEVPHDPILADIWGEGWARAERSGDILDTVALADIARNVAEIDHSEPQARVRWQTHGAPYLMPGNTVEVVSDTIGISGLQWLMRVEHTLDSGGFHTTCEGWRGAGEALPAGADCVVTPVPGGPWHVGDENVPWYAVPNPNSGRQVTIPFTVAEYYSSIAVYGLAHGSNSYQLGGVNADAEVSRFEIWQFGERVGTGNLPVLAENYSKRLPYGAGDTHWSRIVIPITGSLEPGTAELRILSGEDRRLPASTKWDDFEVKSLTLRTCGVGEPRLPEVEA